MFDLKWVRENADAFDAGLAKRGVEPMAEEVLALDRARRACQTTLQDGQARRNTVSREIGVAKSKGEDASDLIAEVSRLKSNLKKAEQQEKQLRAELDELMSGLPNLPADGVPEGADENDNEEIRRWGKLPEFDFEPKQHFDIGEDLGLMDFDAAAAMSGARFVVLKGALARLERALGAFMLDLQTGEFGFTETSAPLLVRDQAVFGTGQLPKFADDLFQTTNGYWLIPTAEVPLANLARDQIHDGAKLPMRYAALTQCFRSEAGAAGKDTRGMIRQHQFTKVEMVAITEPERSADELERITKCAEEVLQRLGLCYRVVLLCAGDMGFGSQKTYDLEVWLPGQGCYREISSCSNCGEFQARRMAARYRPADGGAVRYVHTLNGSGLAVGRTLVAIIENYQQADGSVVVPAALRPYMGGLEVVTADA